MSFEVTGKLHKKFDTQRISDRFTKREFVLEIEDGAYSQHIKFQLTQDRCDLIDAYKEGDTIKTSFNLRGKPFQNRQGETVYFTNLEAWRIENNSSSKPAKATSSDNDFPSINDLPPPPANDDLPF